MGHLYPRSSHNPVPTHTPAGDRLFQDSCRYTEMAEAYISDFNASAQGLNLSFRRTGVGNHAMYFERDGSPFWQQVSEAALEVRVHAWLAKCYSNVKGNPRQLNPSRAAVRAVCYSLRMILEEREGWTKRPK